jgi:hypothetical protein
LPITCQFIKITDTFMNTHSTALSGIKVASKLSISHKHGLQEIHNKVLYILTITGCVTGVKFMITTRIICLPPHPARLQGPYRSSVLSFGGEGGHEYNHSCPD